MAGVKGRSGGPRPNSGGARPGAGRKPAPKAPPPPPPVAADEPLEFLLGVMNDPEQDPRLRVRAAVAAAQYVHTKKADGGKKEERADKAREVSRGKFAAATPPRLVSSR